MKKKKLLWIGACTPYDAIPHAGGQVENYWVKHFNQSGIFDFRLFSFCRETELSKVDLDQYGVQHTTYIVKNALPCKVSRWLQKWWITHNPWDQSGGILMPYVKAQTLKYLQQCKQDGYEPDIVLMEWTEIALLSSYVRELFPCCKVIIVEEDVSFQRYDRFAAQTKNSLHRHLFLTQGRNLKRWEIACLCDADMVVVNNPKDAAILLDNGICKEKLFDAIPFFHNYKDVHWFATGHDVLFYGAMNREENYLSALWFIDSVIPLIQTPDVRFVVVGSKPPKLLTDKRSDKVIITGFVENVEPYFTSSFCLAAPLLLGAGIKIKILEALSAGIPILTNHIGIEGIRAQNGKDFLLCESAQEYAHAIDELMQNEQKARRLSESAKEVIMQRYDLEASANEFIQRVDQL